MINTIVTANIAIHLAVIDYCLLSGKMFISQAVARKKCVLYIVKFI